jgi:UDPglucose 6-dehydrogenase
MNKYIVSALFTLAMLEFPVLGDRSIAVIGTGYVGLVLGACLADFGNSVCCADIDKAKIGRLNKGEIPLYEPGLQEIVERTRQRKKLSFSDDPESAIREADIIFIAVGTPMSDDGKADMRYVDAVAKMIGKNLNGYKIICTKSTVPIGTGKRLKALIKLHSGDADYDVVSNPEFLKEGTAVKDFLEPDRVVFGTESDRPLEALYDIYRPLLERETPFLCTDLVSAETIKYAANAFLAVKVSFINEVAQLCDKTGADVKVVAKGMGTDSRIGPKFLNPGPGFGGSCFPKDTCAFVHKAKQVFMDLKIVEAALAVNENQRRFILKKLCELVGGSVEDKKIAVLGLAFKANTDDVRSSPAAVVIDYLLEQGAAVTAYDPVANDNMKIIAPHVTYADSWQKAVAGADAVIVMTEWDEFCTIDLAKMKELMRHPVLFDARNIISTKALQSLGYTFANIGNAKVS